MDYDELLKLAAYIAHYMPEGGRVDRRPIDKDVQHQGARIIGDHHQSLRLSQSYQTKGKIAIRGEYPDYGLTWQQRHHAYLPHSCASINVTPNRNYGGNSHSTSRRYNLYRHKDGGSFSSGQIETSGYGGLSCDMELRSVSIDKAVQILALLRE